jgi:hypothetical protein
MLSLKRISMIRCKAFRFDSKGIKIKSVVVFLCVALINCAFCQDKSISKELAEWYESLDLAYPAEVDFRIQLEKKTLLQGEPLILRCYVINKTAKHITIIPPSNRLRGLMLGTVGFSLLTEKDDENEYQIGFHASGIQLPGSERIISPGDSVYISMILWPNNFYDWNKRGERAQRGLFPTGQYKLYGRIFLGVKWYPKPCRDLIMFSDTVLFTINAIDPGEHDLLVAIDPLMSAFFYKLENVLLLTDSLRQARLALLPVFDEIRRRNSFMVPLVDFVSISIRASTDTTNINPVVADTKRFIAEHEGSLLAEEMEFLLARMLYEKEETRVDFTKETQRIITTYPKNISVFEVKEWLQEK